MLDSQRVTQAHQPSMTNHLQAWCYSGYLTASTHYNSGALIPACGGLSLFKEDTSKTSVPVREINLVACPVARH